MNTPRKLWHDLAYRTDATGSESLDLSRVLMLFLVLSFVAQSAFALYLRQHFDWSGFGVGGGALLGGSGAGVWLHGKSP